MESRKKKKEMNDTMFFTADNKGGSFEKKKLITVSSVSRVLGTVSKRWRLQCVTINTS